VVGEWRRGREGGREAGRGVTQDEGRDGEHIFSSRSSSSSEYPYSK